MLPTPTLRLALALLAALAAVTARAVDVEDGKLSINGNGSWSYDRTDANRYGRGDPDGDWTTANFELTLTARAAEAFVIASQLGWERGEVELEWAFAEWRALDTLRLRAGKVKQPLGNYMELQDVGTARAFFELPTSIYGPTELGATSYSGVGATGDVPLGSSGFALQYDAYGGAIALQTLEPYDVFEPGFPAGEPIAVTSIEAENIAGGRLSLVTPWDLTLRVSGFGGNAHTDDEEASSLSVVGVSLWYRNERLWVSAEAFRAKELEEHRAGYVEVAWFVLPRLQLAGRYELARVTMDGVPSSTPELRHDEWGAGASWWFTPQVVARASLHGVRGKRFVLQDPEASEVADRTLRVVAGVQFSF